MKAIAALPILVAFGPFVGFSCSAAEKEKLPPMTKPLVAISGADSHVSKQFYLRVATPEDWSRVWERHLGTTRDNPYRPLMEVDFDRCFVVVVFRGDKVNIRQLQIDSLSETADSIVIRFEELGYQTAGTVDEYKTPDRPYAFIILPKSDKTIVIEENINRSLQGGPPEWKECARLAGT